MCYRRMFCHKLGSKRRFGFFRGGRGLRAKVTTQTVEVLRKALHLKPFGPATAFLPTVKTIPHNLAKISRLESGKANRPLTPILLKSISINLLFLSWCFCKSMPSSWQKHIYIYTRQTKYKNKHERNQWEELICNYQYTHEIVIFVHVGDSSYSFQGSSSLRVTVEMFFWQEYKEFPSVIYNKSQQFQVQVIPCSLPGLHFAIVFPGIYSCFL